MPSHGWLDRLEHCSFIGQSFTGQAIWLKRSKVEALRSRLLELETELRSQIQGLPLGHERWLDTERELNAAETALSQLGDWRLG